MWHYRLGHIGFDWIAWLGRQGFLGSSGRALRSDPAPLCAACQYARAKRRPTADSVTHRVNDMKMKESVLFPGQIVSVDQYVCSQKGRLPTSRGSTRLSEMYCGGTIFVDLATTRVKVYHQVSFGAEDTIRSKQIFERDAIGQGIVIQTYQSDNGIFKAIEFVAEIEKSFQLQKFAGVGAHHHNGIAENAIRTVTEHARAMMLHAALHWPDVYDPTLWPFAMDYAVYLWDMTPRDDTNMSPNELYAKAKQRDDVLTHSRVWGCPAYVLDPRLQDGKKLPRWQPKSRRGQFVGFSNIHAASVGLIRNLDTEYVTPQFHVVYDNQFQTTFAPEGAQPAAWAEIVSDTMFDTPYDEAIELPPLHDQWLSPQEREIRDQEDQIRRNRVGPILNPVELAPDQPLPLPTESPPAEPPLLTSPLQPRAIPAPTTPNPSILRPPSHQQQARQLPTPQRVNFDPATSPSPIRPRMHSPPPSPVPVPPPSPYVPPSPQPLPPTQMPPTPRPPVQPIQPPTPPSPMPPPVPEPPKVSTRSGRTVRPPKRFMYDGSTAHGYNLISDPFVRTATYFHHLAIDPVTGLVDSLQPHLNGLLSGIFNVRNKKRNHPDTPTFAQAMNGPHREEFKEAMVKEIDDITAQGAWTPILRSEMPFGAKLFPGTWAFRIKRFPDGRTRSFKARYNIRGDLMRHGVDFTDIPYAPLVAWSTVRLMLVVGCLLDLYTCCVDFTSAFAQSPLHDDLFIELPKGSHPELVADYVLRLEHSLYGHPGSPHAWCEYLAEGLIKRGFVRSPNDPCLFVHPDMVCITYCDDCLWWSPDQTKLEAMLDDLSKEYPLKFETGDVHSYLGVEVKREASNLYLTQTGLIDDVLASTGLTASAPTPTPSTIVPLGPDEDGEPIQETWSYPSVIGKLNYLANNTRPDIAFAVHQCARFTHRPKRSHEVAVKRIIRYLKGTSTMGLIYHTDQIPLTLDCYVDADFAGLWGSMDPEDPTCVKSRSGYVILFGNAPLIWASKLQTEVAMSTMEAEYIAMSTSMRELIPMRALVAEVLHAVRLENRYDTTIHSTVYEDNNAALIYATAPRMSSRTKHIATKYHFFRSHVENGEIQLRRVDTQDQIADILTKGLPPEKFRNIRVKLLGW